MAAAGLAALGALASLLSGGASATGSGTATARAADVGIAANAGAHPTLATLLAGLDLSASTQQETAPSGPGSNTSTVGLAANSVAASATTGAVTATATRAADSTTGDSTVDSAAVHLLTSTVLHTGVISSSSTCSVSGAPTASTSAAGVSVGGRTLDAATGDSADVAVTAAGLIGATVTVAVSSPHSTTADSATATGLLVALTLHGTLVATTTAVSVPLGTVTFAASSCETPSAAAPAVTGLTPTSGPASGGQTVTLTGSDFRPGSAVSIGGDPATDVVVNQAGTQLTAVTPAHVAGPVDVVVTEAGSSSAPVTYTYLPAGVGTVPTVAGLDPVRGPTSGGQTVTITGSGFEPGTAVTFAGLPATDVTVASHTRLTAVTPAHAVGPVHVIVTTTGGSSAARTYTYEASAVTGPMAPTGPTGPMGPTGGSGPAGPGTSAAGGSTHLPPLEVTGTDPSTGPDGGDQRVIITGSGFVGGATTVRFGSRTATDVVVLNDDTLSVRTPPGSGAVHVVLTDADGTATSHGLYTYVLGSRFSSGGNGALPFTGANTLETVGVGGWLLAAGGWSYLFARRRRRQN